MDLFSINTNDAASVALESLTSTTAAMNNAQSQISTGYRVSSATDDGAAFAIAQRVRTNVATLTTANQQIASADAMVGTTISSLTDVSNTLTSISSTMTELANSSISADTRTQYMDQLQQMVGQVSSYLQDSTYNGKTLIGDIDGQQATSITVVRNEIGTTYGVATWSGNTNVMACLSAATSASLTSGYFQQALSSMGMLSNVENAVNTALNNFGSISNYLNNQISYNSDKIDSLNNGLGGLIDANLAQESAQLQALQIKQELATQSLSLANQAPSILLKLFQ